MSTEEKSNMDGMESKANENKPGTESGNKFTAFLKNHIVASVLAIVLLVVLIWFTAKMRTDEKNYNNEKTELITQYESKIDSLQINHLEFATKVFSWSVRSELLRNNTENINQLITVFVKESGANLVQLINPEDNMVVLSTDKKFEGNPYSGNLNFESNKPMLLKEDSIVRIVTPVMGLNDQIGILIVELKRE